MAAGEGVVGAAFAPSLAGVDILFDDTADAIDVDNDCLKRVEPATEGVLVACTGEVVAGVGIVFERPVTGPFPEADGEPESFLLLIRTDWGIELDSRLFALPGSGTGVAFGERERVRRPDVEPAANDERDDAVDFTLAVRDTRVDVVDGARREDIVEKREEVGSGSSTQVWSYRN